MSFHDQPQSEEKNLVSHWPFVIFSHVLNRTTGRCDVFASAFQKLIEKHSTNSFYIWGDRSILFFLLLQNTLMWRQEWNLANTPHSLRLLVLIVISSSTRDRARNGANLVPRLLTINCTILLIFLVRQDGHATILFLISRLIFCVHFSQLFIDHSRFSGIWRESENNQNIKVTCELLETWEILLK